MTMLTEFIHAFITLWLDAAFWLLFGLAIAGVLHSVVSSAQLARHLGGRGFMPSIKAALLGAPLPLCSCGVIPAAVGLHRAGASKSATTSFLVATPETGIDSIAISYALLGPFMTVARLAAALCSALAAAALTLWWDRDAASASVTGQVSAFTPATSCCTTPSAASSCSGDSPASSCCTPSAPASSCCGDSPASSCCTPAHGHDTDTDAKRKTSLARLKDGLNFAFKDLFADIALWLIVGVAFSALVVAFVPADFLARATQGWAAMLVMVLIGVPMYICASASTPLAAGLLLAGVSPGAVLVFLLAGPATNIATLGIVRRELGTRTLLAYLSGVIGVAVAFGYLINGLVALWSIDLHAELSASETLIPGWLAAVAGVILAGLTLGLLFQKLRQRLQARNAHDHRHASEKQCGASCCK